jgi:hypothetical protein
VIGPMESVMTVGERKQQDIPIDYWDSVHGTFEFRCSCGYSDRGPWEESRYLMIRHVEERHAGSQVKLDLDALEDLIEVLVSPSPLNSWQQLQSGSQV